jgi:hypothetical protein
VAKYTWVERMKDVPAGFFVFTGAYKEELFTIMCVETVL